MSDFVAPLMVDIFFALKKPPAAVISPNTGVSVDLIAFIEKIAVRTDTVVQTLFGGHG
jgi:hypothetical protein